MKLLICTQILDKNNPALGFFHKWIEAFAKECDKVIVLSLSVGEYNLPSNVRVYSLGKEKGFSKIKILYNFYHHIIKERNNYDSVFVHMNQIYIILGAIIWKIFNKKTSIWYAHGAITKSLKLAEKLTDVVFTSTNEGFRIKSNKVNFVGQGIDCNYFKPNKNNDIVTNNIITVGRVSEVKRIDLMIELLSRFRDSKLYIVGPVLTKSDQVFKKKCIELASRIKVDDRVCWVGPIRNDSILDYYEKSDVFINFSENKSLDKAILEAYSSGLPVVSSNDAAIKYNFVIKVTPSVDDIERGVKIAFKKGKATSSDNNFVDEFSIDSLVKRILVKLNYK